MIELLAPVGSAEALRAAVNAGADAVYLAGKSFGARAFADNFSNDELAAAIKYAHLHKVAVHITVNTIVADDECAAFIDTWSAQRRRAHHSRLGSCLPRATINPAHPFARLNANDDP